MKTLDQKIAEQENRLQRLKKEKSNLGTRKKILIGSCITDAIKKNEFDYLNNDFLRELLNNYLIRDHDRKLFDLPLLIKEPDQEIAK